MTRSMNVVLGALLAAGCIAVLAPRAALAEAAAPSLGGTRTLGGVEGSFLQAVGSQTGYSASLQGTQADAVLDVQAAGLVPPQALSAAAWFELALVVVGWLALTWLVFFVLWRVTWTENPFLAVRVAYTISVPFALAYLLLLFWPRYFSYVLPASLSYVPYAVAGVVAIVLLLIVWASHQNRGGRELEPEDSYEPHTTDLDDLDYEGDRDTIDDDYLTDDETRL